MLRPLPILSCVIVTLAAGAALGSRAPAPPTLAAVGAEFTRDVRPLVRQYCTGCHSTAKPAGELDLERFAAFRDVRGAPLVWLKVREALDSKEMPPREALQPTPKERSALSAWVKRYLHAEALASAGDPGPVVLRRLNNAEYTYTVRDLTGVDLDPAREFPSDSAAGEGFTNTGNSLVMSPALLAKYLDAGKEIAQHVELLPDGFRFSPHTTRADWTNAALARIRALYAKHTDSGGASSVNLQGIVFNTNDGGRLPVERYLGALLAERAALQGKKKTLAAVAKERGLSEKYLGLLWAMLNDPKPSPLLDSLRAEWRAAKTADPAAMTRLIGGWQQALWRFTTVGHIGREGGPKAWQEPVAPLAASDGIRLKLPADGKDATVYLTARDAGDGNAGDFAEWRQPRLVIPGRPDVLLRDLRGFTRELTARRERLFASAGKALEAAGEALATDAAPDAEQLARKHGVEPAALEAWLEYLGIGSSASPALAHFGTKQTSVGGYAFVNGWGSPQLPSLVANASNQEVRIPGTLKPRGACVHPTPTLSACVGWQSPVSGAVRVEGIVTHAHHACGNGVTWALELRRGASRRRLAGGIAERNTAGAFAPPEPVPVRPGDLVSLVIGPRDGEHSCDLTDLELTLTGTDGRAWSLTGDITPDVLAGNPHADRFGNPRVWHFYSEPVSGAQAGPIAPAGSVLARWQAAETPAERRQLAAAVQALLSAGPPAGDQPDALLYRQLASLRGPLLAHAWRELAAVPRRAADSGPGVGLDPALFGKHPNGAAVDAASLCVRAPSTVEVRIPAELAAGAEVVATAALHAGTGAGGTVQMQALAARPSAGGLVPDAPVLTAEGGAARKRFEGAFDDFRALFPAALAYTKIVPVDEVVTLTLFHREDEPLRRLMLTEAEARRLDRLWEELHWTSQSPLKLVNAYEQIREFATQDRPDLVKAFEPLRQPILDRAAAFEKALVDAEPRQVEKVIEFAGRAYRRPPTAAEAAELRNLYRRLRAEELPHEEAIRLTLARIFVAPAFLYRLETAPPGTAPGPVTDWELASRLSYFLWSSLPDDKLRAAAASGTLRQPQVLAAQVRRMVADPKARRLATEFACQWLQIYEFDALDEKSERHFPEFAALRKDMYEEAIRFLTDLFQRDASILSVYDADHTFVNDRLARFYGIPGVTGEGWRRVEGMRARERGGILGLSATLAKQSGASRTSPILRGVWISEVLLGEKLPRPPKDVPLLPEDETATEGLTVRQLVARHTSDPRCSGCHAKIDPYGFALEGFDAIGRFRTADLANRPVDTKTKTPDGQPIEGLGGLRDYLLRARREAVLRQFNRKLLGYALGRSVRLSDEPLLTDMQAALAKQDFRFSAAVEKIVTSRQFREIRGAAAPGEEP